MKALAVACILLTGCLSVEAAAPRVRTRQGPAASQRCRRVVAIPATCGSLSEWTRTDVVTDQSGRRVETTCFLGDVQYVDAFVRAELAFRGLSVIDGETVNAETRGRTEQQLDGIRTARVEGARLEDATPGEQAAVFAALGADGIVGTRIWIGAAQGTGARRTAMVQIRLLDVRSGELAWATRCEIEIGGIVDDTIAVRRAADCAMRGVR